MPAGNWLDRQPGHVRKFVWALSIAAAVLLLALLVTLREQPDWVPAKSRAFGELVPPSADTDIPHYTPETLPLRTIDEIGAVAMAEPYSLRWRVGVAAPDREPLYFDWPTDRPGWYLNWSSNLQKTQGWFGFGETAVVDLPDPGLGMEFTPMVNVQHGRLFPEPAALQKMAANNPGLTWLIGNEPDVIWQDNTPPEIYAIAYQRAYEAIKSGDPTAKVAIGGVSQITPLRLAYLDRVWDFYLSLYGEEIPVDIWNMHAFVLREDRNTWGVNIPPGFPIELHGAGWEIEDHDDLTLIEDQIRAMRIWMQAYGQQDKPLWISEYGILMPEDYGFPPERVTAFLENSFDLFVGLQDPTLGYPPDDYRLVQRWVWYPVRDSRYRTGNLFDDWGEITPVGEALRDYLAAHDP